MVIAEQRLRLAVFANYKMLIKMFKQKLFFVSNFLLQQI